MNKKWKTLCGICMVAFTYTIALACTDIGSQDHPTSCTCGCSFNSYTTDILGNDPADQAVCESCLTWPNSCAFGTDQYDKVYVWSNTPSDPANSCQGASPTCGTLTKTGPVHTNSHAFKAGTIINGCGG